MASSSSTPLPWASQHVPLPHGVPSLADLAPTPRGRAKNITLTIVNSTDVHLAVALLKRVISNGSLNFRLGCVFRDCRHEEISSAVAGLDLLAAVPTHRSIPGPRG